MNCLEVSNKLQEILRLDTDPVAITMYKDKEKLPRKPLDYKINLCQLVSTARYQGRPSSGVPEMMVCAMGAACVGLIKTPEAISSGKAAVGPYCANEEAGKKFMENTFKLGDKGKQYEGIYVEPLSRAKEEPDVVVVYVNPAQVMRLVHACAYDNGEKVAADTVCEAALCSSIGFALANNKPTIGFPCAGDRIFGGTQNQELVFVAPYSLFRDKLIDNLEKTAKGGFSVYPVPPNMAWTPSMPPTYTIQPEDLK
ncbi:MULTISPECIES: DUF169 domain-containing protein [Tepidanaerobacter]|uniref:DUF169 domain-containing protein n=1 Tax=Tepidanaerobacter TaxID=499228 RepID=UPI000B1CF65F|nr:MULTISPECIES: DUF169 domain-containing protein [Tepidanaerobacter]